MAKYAQNVSSCPLPLLSDAMESGDATITALFLLRTDVGDGGTARCTNISGQSGICINIKQCPALLNMLREQRQIPGVADFLRASACGYEGNDPKVCCPGLETRPTGAPPDNSSRASVRTPVGLPDMSECGTPFVEVEDTRIVGGHPAKLGECVQITG